MSICSKCKRLGAHTRFCKEIAPFIEDAIEIIEIRTWSLTDRVIANVASLLKNDGYPKWYRPIGERAK